MSIKRKLITGIASIALLLNAFTPLVFADTSLVISRNGADSENKVEVESSQTTTVVQNNDAFIKNDVEAKANSGGNEADRNTGDVTIETGDASADVDVENKANLNVADVGCTNCEQDTTVTICGNGADSENEVELDGSNVTEIHQDNNAKIINKVDVSANSGYNEAKRNSGEVTIGTGDASVDIDVRNAANANMVTIGNGDGGSLELMISGNGADSENDIELEGLLNSITIVQDNDAKVINDVEGYANSGKNEAEKNNGGDVTIETGGAMSDVMVENMVNFNYAEVGCCDIEITATISGNGADSENEIEAEDGALSNILEVFQGGCNEQGEVGNKAFLLNEVESFAKSGYNEAEENSGGNGCFACNGFNFVNQNGCCYQECNGCQDNDCCFAEGSLEIETGDAESNVEVSNSGNVNVFGRDADFPFSFDWDWDEIFSLFHT